MKQFIFTTFLFCLISPIKAEVDPDIHKLCLPAADYTGCVNSQSKKTIPISKEKIIIQESNNSVANSCPSGKAYVGNGLCREVKCDYPMNTFKAAKGHDQMVAGKSNWKCKQHFFKGVGLLTLGEEFTKAENNPICPKTEPALGWNSSCEKINKNPTIINLKDDSELNTKKIISQENKQFKDKEVQIQKVITKTKVTYDWRKAVQKNEISMRWKCEDRIKDGLKDPRSYRANDVSYYPSMEPAPSLVMVQILFRAKNSFGGYAVQRAVCHFDNDVNIQRFKFL